MGGWIAGRVITTVGNELVARAGLVEVVKQGCYFVKLSGNPRLSKY